MKRMIALAAVLLLAAAAVFAEEFSVPELVPEAAAVQEGFTEVPLYCGPTQQAYRADEAVIDLSSPFVLFGISDCWAMVARGTPEDFGMVGWIEAGDLAPQDCGQELELSEPVSAILVCEADLTEEPCAENPKTILNLSEGTGVSVLAVWQDWVYIQYEDDTVFLRAFVPKECLRTE